MTEEQIIGIFLSQRGIHLSKSAESYPKHNMTLYSYEKSAYDFISEYATSAMKITNGTQAELNASKDKS